MLFFQGKQGVDTTLITMVRLKRHQLEAVVQRCAVKKVFLDFSQNSLENICSRVSFLIKLQAFIKKETLAQVFSCEFYEISKNTFLHTTPLVAASDKAPIVQKLVFIITIITFFDETKTLPAANCSKTFKPFKIFKFILIIL